MTLNNILNEIQYGPEYTKFQIVKESVLNSFDDETGIFYASKRIKELSNKIVLEEKEEKIIGRILAKLNVFENKLEEGKVITEAYKKMQATAISEDCTALVRNIENVKKIDSEKVKNISKIVSTAKYFVESFVDDKVVFLESDNLIINRCIKEDMNCIKQIIL
jgi:hypothetical protein